MQLKLFILPVKNVTAAEAEMNAFLRGHRVLAVKKEFVPDGENSFWTFCVEHLEGTTPPAGLVRGDMFIAPTPATSPSPVRGGMFIALAWGAVSSPARGDMFIAPTPNTCPSPVRGDMFIAPTSATSPSPVRGGMFIAQAKDGFSRSGVSSGAMPPLPGWTTVLPWFYKHAAPMGLACRLDAGCYKHGVPTGLGNGPNN